MKNKKVSANFAVFIISFLIFTTVLVFALLLFLSYENMYNTKASATIVRTDCITCLSKLKTDKYGNVTCAD